MNVPTGWSHVPLHEVALVQTGLSKSQHRRGPSVRRPYLRVANVQDGFLDLSNIKEIDVPLSQVDRFQLRSGDVLLTEGGDFDKLGRGAIWRAQIPDCVHQNHVFAVRVKSPDILLPEFLALQIQSRAAKRYFLGCAKQSTNLASINSTQLKKLPVLLPSVPEQRFLVSLVLDWDAAIEKTEQLIAAKERNCTALAQRLISRGGFNCQRLSDLAERISRKNTHGGGHPLTISGRDGLVSQSRFFDKRIAAKSTEAYLLVRRGEFAYNRSYSAGYPMGAIKRLDGLEEGIVSSLYLCFALKAPNFLLSDYFVAYCEAGGFNRQLSQIAKEGARNHGLLNVGADDFFAMSMPLPPLERQSKVVEVLQAVASEVTLLRDELHCFRKQKHGLMQKLLTGQRRLKVSSPEVA